jgi:NAD(P)H-hydrate epimerase
MPGPYRRRIRRSPRMFVKIKEASVPFLTTEQMVEVDRAMIEDYRVLLIQMMENAGRNLAHLARVRFFSGDPTGKRVAILPGVGGNGGGALVCARRLQNWGASVEVFVTKPREEFTEIPRHQLGISVPPELYAEPALRLQVSALFSQSDIVCVV